MRSSSGRIASPSPTKPSSPESQPQADLPVSKGFLSELRSGKKDNPTRKHIEALARFFDVDATYFVGDPDYADRVAAELKLLAGMKRAGVREIALRASDLSDSDLSMIEAILETLLKSERGDRRQ